MGPQITIGGSAASLVHHFVLPRHRDSDYTVVLIPIAKSPFVYIVDRARFHCVLRTSSLRFSLSTIHLGPEDCLVSQASCTALAQIRKAWSFIDFGSRSEGQPQLDMSGTNDSDQVYSLEGKQARLTVKSP